MFKFNKKQKVYLFLKRIIDIFGSCLGIILFSIPLGVVALIIKCTSRGPIFFLQERYGKNKKIFKIIKFRSMKIDAPEKAPSDMTIEEQRKYQYKFGSFLRKSSIDEIPQLFNIFVGHMSFIGPRPGAAHNEEYLAEERSKTDPSAFLVKPGLSGFAQIHMKRKHEAREKAVYDSFYVEHLSLTLDISIFCYSTLIGFGFAKGR